MNGAEEFEHEHDANGGTPLDVLLGRLAAVGEQSDVVLAISQVPVTADADIDEEAVEVAAPGRVVALRRALAPAQSAIMAVCIHDATW
jgi:hypothetical protein